jgi:lipopolysaccharide assembly outer membrane protein LptD (OstA)
MNKNFTSIALFLFFLLTLAMGLKANNNTYINSSNIIYNEKENKIELAENSKININNINILIDRGIIDYENDKIEIFGNFYIFEDSNILSGKNLIGNANLDTVRANDVSYLYNNNLKIDSDSIKKNKNKITFYDNFLTPCKLDGYFNCPTWSLRVDKTDYYIEEDQFKHFDTFLQIADYKIFYLPYFTHYGSKAPRKKGFLTPTIEFNIEGDSGINNSTIIYLSSESSDLLIKPNILLNHNF